MRDWIIIGEMTEEVREAVYGPRREVPPCPGYGGRNSWGDYVRRAKVWAKTGGYCYHCGKALTLTGEDKEEAFHCDHLLAKSRGGSDKLPNRVPSCARCNYQKGPRGPGWKPDSVLRNRGPIR